MIELKRFSRGMNGSAPFFRRMIEFARLSGGENGLAPFLRRMIELKRFWRGGVVFSAALHGCLLLGFLLINARADRPPPPEAMAIEIVPASEAPQPQDDTTGINGTPLESTSNGSEVSSDAEKGSANAAPPKPKTKLPSLQQAQAQPNPEHKDGAAAAQAQTSAPEQPETQPEASEPILLPNAPTIDPQPRPKQAASQAKPDEMFAMPLALPGGKLGGGFDAPAPTQAMLPHDDTAAFRARLSSCSHLPAGFNIEEDIAILVQLNFKRDGTLATAPKLLRASLSPDAGILLDAAVRALEQCQPFTELKPDKYKIWKTMNLVVTPLGLSGG